MMTDTAFFGAAQLVAESYNRNETESGGSLLDSAAI